MPSTKVHRCFSDCSLLFYVAERVLQLALFCRSQDRPTVILVSVCSLVISCPYIGCYSLAFGRCRSVPSMWSCKSNLWYGSMSASTDTRKFEELDVNLPDMQDL